MRWTFPRSSASSAGGRREASRSGLRETVAWYLENGAWWQPLTKNYAGERLGQRQSADAGTSLTRCACSSSGRPARWRGRSRARSGPKGPTLTSLDRKAADFSQPEQLGAIVRDHAPDVVIIAAAYTQVDKAESEEALANDDQRRCSGRNRSGSRCALDPRRAPLDRLCVRRREGRTLRGGRSGRADRRLWAHASSPARSPCAKPIRST